MEKLVDNLAGLPLHDVERLTRQAIFTDGALTEDDIKPLLAAKYQLLNRGGTLSFEADTARFAEVGGHEEPAPLDPAAQGRVRRQRARTSMHPRACCC